MRHAGQAPRYGQPHSLQQRRRRLRSDNVDQNLGGAGDLRQGKEQSGADVVILRHQRADVRKVPARPDERVSQARRDVADDDAHEKHAGDVDVSAAEPITEVELSAEELQALPSTNEVMPLQSSGSSAAIPETPAPIRPAPVENTWLSYMRELSAAQILGSLAVVIVASIAVSANFNDPTSPGGAASPASAWSPIPSRPTTIESEEAHKKWLALATDPEMVPGKDRTWKLTYKEERDGRPVRRHVRSEEPEESAKVLDAAHEPAASSPLCAGVVRRSVKSFCADRPNAVSSATCGSGGGGFREAALARGRLSAR